MQNPSGLRFYSPKPLGRIISGLIGGLLIWVVAICSLPQHGYANEQTFFVPQTPTAAQSAATLRQNAQGEVTFSVHPMTGQVRFVRVAPNGDLLPAAQQSLSQKAENFFTTYAPLFGLQNPTQELTLRQQARDAYGFTHLVYDQRYAGIPVFGGQLRAHFDEQGKLIAVNGVTVADIALNTTPTQTPATVGEIALRLVASQITSEKAVGLEVIAAPQLYIFQAGLIKGAPEVIHLVYEIEVTNAARIVREFLYIDAHSGKPVEQISGIHALEREIYEGSLASKKWDEGSGNPDPIPSGWAGGTTTQVKAWNDEIKGAKETYNFFASLTAGARLSYDGQNAIMKTINNKPDIQCPNANWNGATANYCNGVTADDIVAHEWGHAYTEYTSDLVYLWQPGALNESYSDIWGETVDFLNGRGSDTPGGLRTAGSCSALGGSTGTDNSLRWLMGEDATSFNGAIRDMWNPTCFDNPGKVSDANYWCSVEDDGGVHINSGVPNHLFALLVDGGVYNGVTVNSIGLTRAAHLHWYAQKEFLTPVSDFADHADHLTAACTALIGKPLYQLTTAATGWGSIAPETITQAHCTEVANAIAAVELRRPPTQCNFTPTLNPNAPALCTAPNVAKTFFLETWESGLNGWTVGARAQKVPGQFNIPNWRVVATPPASTITGPQGAAIFGEDPIRNGDSCNSDNEAGVTYLQSPVITIPAVATAPRLAFHHWFATESRVLNSALTIFDGGNLKIRVNNGAWNLVPANVFVFNAYNGALYNDPSDFRNPLGGEPAFGGMDAGSVGGSWGQSQINLSGIAKAGDIVQLRFELGFDGCAGLEGWYVDTVRAFACTPPPRADLSIVKSVTTPATGSALPGQAIAYRIQVTNAGPDTATGIVITDSILSGLTDVAFTVAGATLTTVQPAPLFVWKMSDLALSQQAVIEITGKVNPSFNSDNTLTNQVQISAIEDDIKTNNNASAALSMVVPRVSFVQSNFTVSETVASAKITLTLNGPNPHADVQVGYQSNDSSAKAGQDYQSASGGVTIPKGATNATIPITILNDRVIEPDENFQIQMISSQGAALGTTPGATVTIRDDDVPGVLITPLNGTTSEAGGAFSFTLELATQPAASVTVNLISDDPTEGTINQQLVFTPDNWNTSQTAAVVGVDDDVDDGPVFYHVLTTVQSSDPQYALVNPTDLVVMNTDDEIARLSVTKLPSVNKAELSNVITYTYQITNSGNVTLSNLRAHDDHLGAVALSVTTLAPRDQSQGVLTYTVVLTDLPGPLLNTVMVTGTSIGANVITGSAQASVKLLDAEFVLTATVGIHAIGDPCTGSQPLRVPVGTTMRYCYNIRNTGVITLLEHTAADRLGGVLLNKTLKQLTSGEGFSTTVTAMLNVTATNPVTWTATLEYVPPGLTPDHPLLPFKLVRHYATTVAVSSPKDDQDKDTIPDNVEGAADVDQDGKPNYLDTDADGDGRSDQVEAGLDPLHPGDSNQDGVPDYLDKNTLAPVERKLYFPIIRR